MRLSILLILLLTPFSGAAAQVAWDEAALDAEVRRLALELRCPRCQGLSIADSPDDLAVQMNVVIREQLVEGRTPAEIRAYFVSRYGEWILLKPDPAGFNLLVYAGPVLAILAGAALLISRVRRWTSNPAGAGVAAPPLEGGG